jgi:hypothetical protein
MFMIWIERLRRDALISVHRRSSVVSLSPCLRGERAVPCVSHIANREIGVPGTVCATVQKVKHPAGEKIFIPSGIRSYAPFRLRVRTEFRHDSCNTAPS